MLYFEVNIYTCMFIVLRKHNKYICILESGRVRLSQLPIICSLMFSKQCFYIWLTHVVREYCPLLIWRLLENAITSLYFPKRMNYLKQLNPCHSSVISLGFWNTWSLGIRHIQETKSFYIKVGLSLRVRQL